MAAVYQFAGQGDGPVSMEENTEVLGLLSHESNIPRIEEAAASYKGAAFELLGSQDPTAINRDVMKRVITTQKDRFYGCLSLPFSLFFFIVYTTAVILHEDITAVFMIESSLRGYLSDGADDIGDIAGVWDWLEGSLVPNAFSQSDFQDVPYPNKTMWSRVLTYNQVTGPVVLEQLRSTRDFCNSGNGITGDMYCFDQRSRSTDSFGKQVSPAIATPVPGVYAGGEPTLAERTNYYESSFKVKVESDRRLARGARPEFDSKLPSGTANKDRFVAAVYPNTPLDLIGEHLNYLKEKEWLDAQTKYLKVQALLINAELGRPRLEQFLFGIAFSRAGGLWTNIRVNTIFLRAFASAGSIACDIIFCVLLFFIILLEIKSLRNAAKKGQTKKYVRSLWFILEFVIIVVGLLIAAGYFYEDMLRKGVVEAYEAVVDSQIQDLPADTNQQGTELAEKAENMRIFTSYFRLLTGLYTLILMVRFFCGFSAQPRLAAVTKTLEVAAFDIFHFLVVLTPTWLAYALAGCFIFGRRMEEFATMDASIGYCFKLMIEGEYDWPYYSEELYWTSMFWMWSFMLLLNVIMLNMVLAIILDVYGTIRAATGQSETVWVTLWQMLIQLRRVRVWVSSDKLLEALPRMPLHIRRDDVLAAFPGMCDEQLDILMNFCFFQVSMDEMAASEGSQAMKMALCCKLAMDQVSENVKQLHEGTMETTGLKQTPGSTWVQGLADEMAVQNHMMVNLQWKLQQVEWQWKAMESIHGKAPRFQDVQPHEDPGNAAPVL